MNIAIIGTGNVATVLGKLLKEAGHPVIQVFGRHAAGAAELATLLHALPCSSWQHISREADLYLIALPDKVLYELPPLLLGERIVVHTAGSVPIHVLKDLSLNHGALYPLQSLRKEMPVLTSIPLLVNASNTDTESRLMQLAQSLASDVKLATDHQRLQYHAAAVFVNNFTNHLYAVAERFCRSNHIDFGLLFPLALETVRRLAVVSPMEAVTGPAIRNDQVTIQNHLELLKADSLMHTLYIQLTESIQSLHADPGHRSSFKAQ